MKRMSPYQRGKVAKRLRAQWEEGYGRLGRKLKTYEANRDAEILFDRYVIEFSFCNLKLISLDVWRLYRYVLPVKGDTGTFNAKKIALALRRIVLRFARGEKRHNNLAAKALLSEGPSLAPVEPKGAAK